MKKDYSNHKNGPITQKLHNFFSIFYTFHSFTLKLAPNDYAKFQIRDKRYFRPKTRVK